MKLDELLRECAALRAQLEELKTVSQSEERLRLAVEASEVGVFDFDPASGKQTFSPTALKIWGLKPDSPTDPEHVLAAIHPEDRAKTLSCAEQSLDPNGAGEFVTEHRLIRPDGTERWISVSAKAIFAGENDQRHAVRAVGTMLDVTARKQAESRLVASEERLRLAIDVAGLGMISIDYTTNLCTLDHVAANLFGFKPDKPIDRSQIHQRIHSQDRAAVMQLIDGALDPAGDGTFAIEHRVVLPSGEERWLAVKKVVKFACINGQRRPLTSLATVMNVTARKQNEQLLRQSEQRYRTIVDATSAVTWDCPPNGLQVRPQPSWMTFTGQSSSEALGDGWTKAIHPDDLSLAFSKWSEAVASGRPFTNEHRIRRHDSQWRWMSVFAAPICDTAGNIVEWFGMCLDIATRKQSEEQLRNADQRKDEFLATLAHELRNPLTPIKAGIDIIKLSANNPVAVENARIIMERQVEQMTRLIDDLMDVSRIRSGKIVLRKSVFSLNRAIQIAADASHVLIDKKKQQLVIQLPDEPIYVNCDLSRLSQVLANLLNNAAKYTDIEGLIRLSVQRFGDDVRIEVRDNGIGISSDMLDRVFELFSQVDSSLEKTHGGLGIGLTLAKRLIEMHDGTLTAVSEGSGKGSTFIVHLHNAATDRGAPPFLTSHQPYQSNACLNILVIEDNPDVAAALMTMLSLMGHSAKIACDGIEGLKMAASLKPDAILMDLGLPKLSGFDTCRRIRQQPWGKDISIIAMTGWGADACQRKSMDSGFDHFLTKPVALDDLTNLLSELRHRA